MQWDADSHPCYAHAAYMHPHIAGEQAQRMQHVGKRSMRMSVHMRRNESGQFQVTAVI